MMVLVSYDVATKDPMGKTRLRRVAKAMRRSGQRVQFSVFMFLRTCPMGQGLRAALPG